MNIKASRTLNQPLVINGPDKTITLSAGGSADVDDSWLNIPSVRQAASRGSIAITNYCGILVGIGISKVTVSNTTPEGPRIGDLWLKIES